MIVSPASGLPRKLRIAVLTRTFSSIGGGAERYSIALVEHLAARHDIHVFAQEIDHQWLGVTYHRVSAPFLKPRWINQLWFAAVTWWATRHGFDVVHSHENTWHGDIQTVHVLPVKYNLFHGRTGWRLALRVIKAATSLRLLTYLTLERLRYAVRPGRQVIVTSDSLQAIMAASYPACGASLSCLTPGIILPELPVTPQRKNQARISLGLPAAGPCVLFVANDYRKKGLHALLEAMTKLSADVVLAIVGNGAQISQFTEQVNRLNLGGRIFFLGALKDVGPAYEAADMLAHPTLEDTFAMVVLEAMAHGLPVVVSGPKHCGISGLLTHGVNALILDEPEDISNLARSLLDVISQPILTHRLAQGATDFAMHYQWRELAVKQEILYFSTIAAKIDPKPHQSVL